MPKNDRAKLVTLLHYWIEHNREHSVEIGEWVARAARLGGEEVARDITQAARAMDKSAALLSRALQRLGEKEG